MAFVHYGTYICKCGREFNNSQSFCGHKGHCKVGKSESKLLEQEQRQQERILQMRNGWVQACKDKRETEKLLWVSEHHHCEECGNLMTEKYASGRFCSEFCSRSYASKIAKQNPKALSAFEYGRNRSSVSPYEEYIQIKLIEYGIVFIPNATRKQYTTIPATIKQGRYILDFYLPDYKIDLEYDGRLHKDTKDHDMERDAYLNKLGITVYRIKDYDTNKTLDDLFDDFITGLRDSVDYKG